MSDVDWDNDGAWAEDDEGEWGESSYDEKAAMGELDDTSNPAVSWEADQAEHSQAVQTSTKAPAQVPPQQRAAPPVQGGTSLVGKFDAKGKPFAACKMAMQNGKPIQVTSWKVPTADEYNALMFQSKRIVMQGGVAGEQVPTGTNAAATSAAVPLGAVPTWKKAAKLSAGVAVVGGIGWLGYKFLNRD